MLQEKYLGEVLLRFQVDSPRAASTPLPPGCKLCQADSPQSAAEKDQIAFIPYRSALTYLAVCTRPDIAAAVSSLSRFNRNLGMAHWEGVQHVLRYLKGTSGPVLQEGNLYQAVGLLGYYSSHLTCPATARSRAASVLLSAGGAISWQSKLVANASLSSCDSEYMGFFMATQEVSFLRQLQLEMQGKAGVPASIVVYVEMQPALDIVNNPVYHARSKQILAKYHFVRDKGDNCFFRKSQLGRWGLNF